MDIVIQLLGCGGAAAFFALLFNSPKRCILPAAGAAMVGYSIYLASFSFFDSEWVGIFFGSVAIAALSELISKKAKAPAVIFISIGIIPMVPGAGLYNTMLALVQGSYDQAAVSGTNTLLSAGAIALGVAAVTSLMYGFRKRGAKRREG